MQLWGSGAIEQFLSLQTLLTPDEELVPQICGAKYHLSGTYKQGLHINPMACSLYFSGHV